MSLSNRETPRYYAEFRKRVLTGEIPVCEQISQEMNRIDALVADPRYYYNSDVVDGFVSFCEDELTLTDGSPVVLLDTFKLWAEQLLGWYHYVERDVYRQNGRQKGFVKEEVLERLVKKQYLILARGGAKSMYAAFIQAFFLIVYTQTTHQVTTAPTMKQAEEVLLPIRTAITRAVGPLFKFLTMGSVHNTTGSKSDRTMLASTKKGVEMFLTGSLLEVRPMRIDKLQGLRCMIATLDEWLSGDLREDVVGALEQGASKLPDYVIVAISSEGTVRNSVGDEMKLELAKILSGEYYAPHVSIFHYRLDALDEVGNPPMWEKAQPNIGRTVSWDVYKQDVIRAEQAPATRNDILAKRFGIPTEGYTYFFTYEETVPHPPLDFDGMSCSLGGDLSQGDDFCSFAFLFPLRGDEYGVKSLNFISQKTYDDLIEATRYKYDTFIAEGSLIVMPGVILEMENVFTELIKYVEEHDYDILSMGYDPYGAKEFLSLYTQHYGEFNVTKVPQGARTESVPLGDMKSLSEERALLFDEEIFSFAMGNAMTLEDTNGNRKLFKRRYEAKIDPVAALMDAMVSYREHGSLY